MEVHAEGGGVARDRGVHAGARVDSYAAGRWADGRYATGPGSLLAVAPGQPVSECAVLCYGDGAHGRGGCRRRV